MQVWEGFVEGQEEADRAAAVGAKAAEAKAIPVSMDVHVVGAGFTFWNVLLSLIQNGHQKSGTALRS